MAGNFIHHGDHVTLAAPYALTSGAGALVGSLFGVAIADAASGADTVLATMGVWNLLAEGAGSGQAIAVGAAVYWDNTNKRCTATSAGNTKIGVATAAKATTDVLVRVRLNGTA